LLVEDASFCHRCGKAQREFLVEEPAAPEYVIPVVAATPETATNQPVSFANAAAVRVGFLTASVAAMLDALPFVGALFLVWSTLAGYFAVMLYRRRTGQRLTVRSGAKMGMITGVLHAMIIVVFSTLAFVASTSESTANIRQQLSAIKDHDPTRYAQVSGFLDTPYGLATFAIFALLAMGLVFMLAGTAGGALSAKVAKKD
jgi:hypothetical protein